MGRRSVALAILAAGLCLPAAPASAAELTRAKECRISKSCEWVLVLTYEAAPGELNDLTLSFADGRFTFRDRVAIAAPPGCLRRDANEVTCEGDRAVVHLGDGPDASRATTAAPAYESGALVDGGPGDDRLDGTGATLTGGEGRDVLSGRSVSGGPGEDTLTGTAGGDFLSGGPDADVLLGGAGDDSLHAADASTAPGEDAGPPLAPDVLDGGPGSDTVRYDWSPYAVRVDLGTQTGGAPGEGDRLSGIEHAAGGDGDDVLIGDAGANRLHGSTGRNTIAGGDGDDELGAWTGGSVLIGGDGDDRLDGGGDDDVLDGGPGADELRGNSMVDRYLGGDGDDVLVAGPGLRRERLSCGAGHDAVRLPGFALVLRDCERVFRFSDGGDSLPAYPRRLGSSRLSFTLPLAGRMRAARLELRLRDRRRPFVVRRLSRRRGTARVRVSVPPAIRRLRRDPLPVMVTIAGVRPIPFCWVIDLPR